jgi:putative glycosyltransferase (TIGR04348 family)
MVALHARRSASAIAAFAKTGQAIGLVLTGTDLYRDIHSDIEAQKSLELADILVVLNERGVDELPAHVRHKTRTIFQSARRLQARTESSLEGMHRTFDLALVGHIRTEKDPLTALRALARLSAPGPAASGSIAPKRTLRLIHIGSDKDESLGDLFRTQAARQPNVILKGPRTHGATRQMIKHCQALVLPSVMEGGANVLIEAVMAGVPVLATRISGSVGMLGVDYQGYFEVGDDLALAKLISRCQNEPSFLAELQHQCEARSALFEPARERQAVQTLVKDLASIRP